MFLVYDIGKAESLNHLQTIWINDLKQNLQDAYLVLVGNKSDYDDNKRQVTQEDARDVVNKYKLDHFTEISAKTGDGIEKLVNEISIKLYLLNKQKLGDFKEDSSSKSGRSRGSTASKGSRNSALSRNSSKQSEKSYNS